MGAETRILVLSSRDPQDSPDEPPLSGRARCHHPQRGPRRPRRDAVCTAHRGVPRVTLAAARTPGRKNGSPELQRVATLGDRNVDVPIDHAAAWRLMLVLKKNG